MNIGYISSSAIVDVLPIFEYSDRTRFEQRFIRDARGTALRVREMIRGDIALDEHQKWALVLYDELFVNVNTILNGT